MLFHFKLGLTKSGRDNSGSLIGYIQHPVYMTVFHLFPTANQTYKREGERETEQEYTLVYAMQRCLKSKLTFRMKISK